jgi:hypothetical protein
MKAQRSSGRAEDSGGINWSQIAQQTVVDGLGRQFRWADIKGKTIFLCGHGTHTFKQGFCTVPPGTDIDFYQIYTHCLDQAWVLRILRGDQVEIDRSITAGRACLNLTLSEDDEKNIDISYARLRESANWQNSYIFMANALDGLNTGPSGNEKALQLEDIFRIAPGNHFKWACCQQVTIDQKNIVPVKNISPHLFPQVSRGPRAQKSGLSEEIDKALSAVSEISVLIMRNYNPSDGYTRFHNRYSYTYYKEGSLFGTVSAESGAPAATSPEELKEWQAGPARRIGQVRTRPEDFDAKLLALEKKIEDGLCNLAKLRLTTPESHRIRKVLQDALRKIADIQRKGPQTSPAGRRR